MDASPAALAAYEAALPPDDRVERKKMFGSPCAFANRQMFFGTFGDSLVARVGPARVVALATEPGVAVFTPTEGQPWDDYVQVPPSTDPTVLSALAAEALAWTVRLPPRAKKPKVGKRARK